MEITNYTRYNTDDLKAMVDSIQLESGFSGWRGGMTMLTISEFSPSNLMVKVYRSSRTIMVRRYTSKIVYSRPAQMSILTPSKIYENPLEELVQNGEQEVPKAMIEAVFMSLRSRATYSSYRSGGDPVPDTMRLRVMKKVAARKPKNEKSTAAARDVYATRNVSIVRWQAHKSANELTRLAKKHLGVTETHLKERKHMVQPLRDAVAAAELALQQVVRLALSLQGCI